MGLVTNWLRFSVTSHLTCLYLWRGIETLVLFLIDLPLEPGQRGTNPWRGIETFCTGSGWAVMARGQRGTNPWRGIETDYRVTLIIASGKSERHESLERD
jgi:hypothetical protein